MECVQWAVLSKLLGSYSFHIFQISKPRVIYFVNRFIWHVGVCRVCVYVCMCRMYVCVYTVWCKTRLKINLRLDTIISPVQFSSFSAQLVFFHDSQSYLQTLFWKNVVDITPLWQYKFSVSMFGVWKFLLVLYLSALMFLTPFLGRISRIIFFSQIKEISQSQGILYLRI